MMTESEEVIEYLLGTEITRKIDGKLAARFNEALNLHLVDNSRYSGIFKGVKYKFRIKEGVCSLLLKSSSKPTSCMLSCILEDNIYFPSLIGSHFFAISDRLGIEDVFDRVLLLSCNQEGVRRGIKPIFIDSYSEAIKIGIPSECAEVINSRKERENMFWWQKWGGIFYSTVIEKNRQYVNLSYIESNVGSGAIKTWVK